METGVPPNGEASTLEVEFVKIPDIMLVSSITEAEFGCVSEIPDYLMFVRSDFPCRLLFYSNCKS